MVVNMVIVIIVVTKKNMKKGDVDMDKMSEIEHIKFLNMLVTTDGSFDEILFSKKSIKKLLCLQDEEEVNEHIDATIKELKEMGIPVQQFFIKGKNNEDFFNKTFFRLIVAISVRKEVIKNIEKGGHKDFEKFLGILKDMF